MIRQCVSGCSHVLRDSRRQVRLQLGVRRDTAVRLARLLLLPPPTASDIASGSMLPPTLEERALYADIQPYVPYRLMLLQHLSPSHFASTSEYAAFAERQLAAFSCGLLAAVHSAPFNHRWQVCFPGGEPPEPAHGREEATDTLSQSNAGTHLRWRNDLRHITRRP